MEKDLPKVNIGEAIDIVNSIIPDTAPKTKVGNFFRWFKKITKVVRKLKPSKKDLS